MIAAMIAGTTTMIAGIVITGIVLGIVLAAAPQRQTGLKLQRHEVSMCTPRKPGLCIYAVPVSIV